MTQIVKFRPLKNKLFEQELKIKDLDIEGSISAELIILTYEALTFQQCDFENKNFVKKSLGKRTGSSQTKCRIFFMSGLKPLSRRRSERISREEKAYVFLYFLFICFKLFKAAI